MGLTRPKPTCGQYQLDCPRAVSKLKGPMLPVSRTHGAHNSIPPKVSGCPKPLQLPCFLLISFHNYYKAFILRKWLYHEISREFENSRISLPVFQHFCLNKGYFPLLSLGLIEVHFGLRSAVIIRFQVSAVSKFKFLIFWNFWNIIFLGFWGSHDSPICESGLHQFWSWISKIN